MVKSIFGPGFIAVFKKGELQLYGDKVDKFNANVDLKGFYNELHDLAVKEKWGDNLEPGFTTPRPGFADGNIMMQEGEFANIKDDANRHSDMFETHFMLSDKGNGGQEFELKWEIRCKYPLSHFGSNAYAIFKLDLVNRFMTDKEFDVGGKKKKLQTGTWEFRNKVVYYNNIGEKISKLPILGNWNWTRLLYYKKLYVPYVQKDIDFTIEKIIGKIYGVINKHFSAR